MTPIEAAVEALAQGLADQAADEHPELELGKVDVRKGLLPTYRAEATEYLLPRLLEADAELVAAGWLPPPDTCPTPRCICRRGHENGHVLANTRSNGDPW